MKKEFLTLAFIFIFLIAMVPMIPFGTAARNEKILLWEDFESKRNLNNVWSTVAGVGGDDGLGGVEPGGSWTVVPDGSRNHVFQAESTYWRGTAAFAGDARWSDYTIETRTLATQYFWGVIACADPTGTTYYSCYIAPGFGVEIWKHSNGIWARSGIGDYNREDPAILLNTWIDMKVVVSNTPEGTSIQVFYKLEGAGQEYPAVPQATALDTDSPYTSGRVGLIFYDWDPRGTAWFDNVVVTRNAESNLTWLPTLGGSSTNPTGINEQGHVAGWSNTDTGAKHAFLWTQKDGMLDLGTLGGTNSAASGINQRGWIVGNSDTLDGLQHAFLWTKQKGMVDLGTLGGATSSANRVNDQGWIIGRSLDASGIEHAFLWTQKDGMVDLGVADGFSSQARYISDSGGKICGTHQVIEDGLGHQRAFFWSAKTGMMNIGTLGGVGTVERAVNNRGWVVGYDFTPLESHAFLWTLEDGMVDLGSLGGTLSYASGINERGWVVGDSMTSEGETHAYLWTKQEGMVDLGTLGGGYSWAWKINERGWVIGHSKINSGEMHGFLWTPEGGMIDIGVSTPYTSTRVQAISNKGEIIGYATTPDDQNSLQAFIWRP